MPRGLDLTGQKFNFLTAIEKTDKRKGSLVVWKFQCDCGNIVELPGSSVKLGNIKSCGCKKYIGFEERNRKQKTIKVKDRFGKLVVIEDLGYQPYSEGHNRTKFLCQCDCGNICEAWSHQLASKTKQSCGCLISKGEFAIETILKENNILYKHNMIFNELTQFCGRQLRFDFIIYNKDGTINRFLEFDGRQHTYGPDTSYWSRTAETLQDIQSRDNIKNTFCQKNNRVEK